MPLQKPETHGGPNLPSESDCRRRARPEHGYGLTVSGCHGNNWAGRGAPFKSIARLASLSANRDDSLSAVSGPGSAAALSLSGPGRAPISDDLSYGYSKRARCGRWAESESVGMSRLVVKISSLQRNDARLTSVSLGPDQFDFVIFRMEKPRFGMAGHS